jgi:type II secretory pathway pseudopilin PulG
MDKCRVGLLIGAASIVLSGSVRAQNESLPSGVIASGEAAQRALSAELQRAWNATAVPTPSGFHHILESTQRGTGLAWDGPAPALLIVPDEGRGFRCPEGSGQCLGRFEGARVIHHVGDAAETVIVAVILVAQSAQQNPEVWRHEITHALLAQHGMLRESERHDPRYFGVSGKFIETR